MSSHPHRSSSPHPTWQFHPHHSCHDICRITPLSLPRPSQSHLNFVCSLSYLRCSSNVLVSKLINPQICHLQLLLSSWQCHRSYTIQQDGVCLISLPCHSCRCSSPADHSCHFPPTCALFFTSPPHIPLFWSVSKPIHLQLIKHFNAPFCLLTFTFIYPVLLLLTFIPILSLPLHLRISSTCPLLSLQKQCHL